MLNLKNSLREELEKLVEKNRMNINKQYVVRVQARNGQTRTFKCQLKYLFKKLSEDGYTYCINQVTPYLMIIEANSEKLDLTAKEFVWGVTYFIWDAEIPVEVKSFSKEDKI